MTTLLAATAITLGGVYYIHESQKQEREVCHKTPGIVMAHLCLWTCMLVQSAQVNCSCIAFIGSPGTIRDPSHMQNLHRGVLRDEELYKMKLREQREQQQQLQRHRPAANE